MALLNRPARIFLSYSKDDGNWRDTLVVALRPLERESLIEIWHDRMIPAGTRWQQEIHTKLESCDIFLAVISRHFVSSDYCFAIEMQRALERNNADEAVFLPVYLGVCQWPSELAGIQRVPGQDPIKKYRDKDVAINLVVSEVERAVKRLRGEAGPLQGPAATQSSKRRSVPRLIKYLCNRKDQSGDLDRRALKTRKPEDWRRPLVLLLHGTNDELHEGFIERLQLHTLPRQLTPQTPSTPARSFYLGWPSLSAVLRSHEPFELFAYELSQLPMCNNVSSLHEVAARLPGTGINMIVSTVNTTDWSARGERVFSACLELWNQWPDIPASARMIVCLKIEYPGSERGPDRELRWKNSPVGKTLLQLDPSLTQEALPGTTVTNGAALTYPGIQVLVLPPLRMVEKWEANEWVEGQEMRQLLNDNEKVFTLRKELNALYQGKQSIPMSQLFDQMQTMLEKVF